MRRFCSPALTHDRDWLLAVHAGHLRRSVASRPTSSSRSATLFDLLNTSSVNMIFAVGLLVVLIAGGIDISFAVAASVVQYLAAVAVLVWIGGGNWLIGLIVAGAIGVALGCINALLIH